MKFHLVVSSLAVCALMAACGSSSDELEFGQSIQANHSWGGYHWARTSNPFTLQLGDNVSSAWNNILQTTSQDWSQSTVLDTTIVAGNVSNLRRCRPTAGRVEVCNTTYGNNGWLGVAGISITGGTHITQAYVKLNDTYFNTAQYNTTAWRNLVSCQEVGHTFGLDHQDENFDNANLGTCMDYTSDPSSNQHPNQHDYQQLQTIYQHLDSTTTIGQSTSNAQGNANANGRSIDLGDGHEDVGAAVHEDAHTSTFVREHGNGNVTVTHVFWAN